MRTKAWRALAILALALVLILAIGFFSIAASTMGGTKGNLYLAAGVAGILAVVGGAALGIYKTLT